MGDQKVKKNNFFQRLNHRYRLVVLNDETFEENLSLRLTPLALFILIGAITIIMVMIVTSLIAFTALREYIPGYSDSGARRNLVRLAIKSDSLEKSIIIQNAYMLNISDVLRGDIKFDSTQNQPDKNKEYNKLKVAASKNENELRKNIEAQDQYSLSYESETNKDQINNFSFFTPIKGIITSSFKTNDSHYGIDIVGPENDAIKATLDGTVILATWSSETGYTITVQHSNNIVSVYKHNSVLLKKLGDYVDAGEPIAIIGNSGEQTTGPHLHFELWHNGNPIDPQDYMVF